MLTVQTNHIIISLKYIWTKLYGYCLPLIKLIFVKKEFLEIMDRLSEVIHIKLLEVDLQVDIREFCKTCNLFFCGAVF